MLIQFNFENFKSFFNEAHLDMTATSSTDHMDHLIEYKKNERYLKTLSIYGANASGKSSVLQAFLFMRNWVLNSYALSSGTHVIPRKEFEFNNKGRTKKSTFDVFFSVADSEYQYGFVVDDFSVHEEWLYKRDFRYKNDYKVIFERNNKKFNLSEELKEMGFMLKKLNNRSLVLSFLSGLTLSDIQNVFQWFNQSIVLDFGGYNGEKIISQIAMRGLKNVPEVQENLVHFLKQVDIDVEGIIFKEKNTASNKAENFFNEEYDVFTLHKNTDTGELEELRIEEESSGTRKFIDIFSFVFTAIESGSLLLIDELSAKLHPLLTRYILVLFSSKKTNPKNAQLIFTTHDTTFLTKELFRRDQICFVEKDEEGMSELIYLQQFKEEDSDKENNLNKEYLSGRYGAIPNFKKHFVEDWNGRSVI